MYRRLVMAYGAASGLLVLHRAEAQQLAPPPDSGLAVLVSTALFDSLRTGGSRPDMVWVAGDPVTLTALQPVAFKRQIELLPPRDEELLCPGSTDADNAPLRQLTGYHVFIRTGADSMGTDATVELFVQAMVRCQLMHRGRLARWFAEGMTWRVTKDERGWRLGKRLDRFRTPTASRAAPNERDAVAAR